MKVCDKCKKPEDVEKINIDRTEFELCAKCRTRVIKWISKSEKGGFLISW